MKNSQQKSKASIKHKNLKRQASTEIKGKMNGHKSVPSAANAKAKTNAAKPVSVFTYKGANDKNVLHIIEMVRAGVGYDDFSQIAGDTAFSMADWANYLQLSERTLQRNQKEKKLFQPVQSEKIIELSMLYQYGVEVFGDKGNFDTWLHSQSIALGGRVPKDLLDTKFGVGLIRDELGRIEHGVLA